MRPHWTDVANDNAFDRLQVLFVLAFAPLLAAMLGRCESGRVRDVHFIYGGDSAADVARYVQLWKMLARRWAFIFAQ